MGRKIVFLALVSVLVLSAACQPKPTKTPTVLISSTREKAGKVVQSVHAAEPELQLTVYNDDMALVNDIRNISLKQGVNEVRFKDVAAKIDATSVHFSSLTDPSGTQVLEQNFEYDLVSTDKLLQKYIDSKIKLVTKDGTEYQGKLLGSAGGIILQKSDGTTVVIRQDDVQEISFPSLPEGLITKPTLSWLVKASKGGDQTVSVAYLTGGIGWHSDYVLALSADDSHADLTGWVTVDNKAGTTFKDAHLKLVAGELHRVVQKNIALLKGAERPPIATPQKQVQERNLFEYHLYDVSRPVTLKDNQTKQIEFVSAHGIPVSKWFVLDSQRTPWRWSGNLGKGNVQVQIRFKNDKESGLGIPLPKGKVRIYKADTDGSQQFVGEDSIDHTPKDENVKLVVGQAFDIVGERTQVSSRKIGDHSRQETWKVEIRNHKDEKVVVHVIEHFWGDWEIVKESQKHQKLDAHTVQYLVEVPANGTADVTYTVMYSW